MEVKLQLDKELENQLNIWFVNAKSQADFKGTFEEYIIILLKDELHTLSLMN